jgi:chemotaxis protein histidine kinase CheA
LNEYTRRDEIFWTLLTVCVLVPAVAVAIVRLVKAKGPRVPNKELIQAAQAAQTARDDYGKARCTTIAKKLGEEVGVFKDRAVKAEREAKLAAEKNKKPGDKEKPLEFTIPWAPTASVLKQARALKAGNCHALSETAAGASANAANGWKAADAAAALKDSSDEKSQQKTARDLLALFKDDKDLRSISAHTEAAKQALETNATATEAEANDQSKYVLGKRGECTPTLDGKRFCLPEGLFARGWAIGVGVLVSLCALIISYVSVWSASTRRAKTLIALRRFANTPEAGLQAAAIVRLAANHNGGEPGMVIGAALGGLIAALLSPTDNPNVFIDDLFVAGSMGGLLIGLAGQWLARTVAGVGKWRERTKELGDIEKPTIPVALILGGVTQGLEKQFLRYFEALPISDASVVVQKLAAQAEEQILAAADLAAQVQMAAQPQGNPWGMPGA